jgi:RNA polymerase sigma factor (sigma-70 family)
VSLPPFDLLLDEHGPSVHRFLVASVGRDAAADCFQDTVVSALRAYPDLRDGRNLKAWFFAVAHSRAMDGHRRRHRRRETPVGAHDAEPAEPPPPEPDDTLWCAVRQLPEKQRESVVLRFVTDLPYRDIGVITGCTEAAARQNVRAGIKRLREVLA